MTALLHATVDNGLCTRLLWCESEQAVELGMVRAEPWYAEGQDIAISKAAWDAQQAAAAQAAAAEAARVEALATEIAAAKADAVLGAVVQMTGSQAASWVDTTYAARVTAGDTQVQAVLFILRRIAQLIVLLARKVLR